MVTTAFENLASWEVEDSDNRLIISENRVEWNHADRTKVRYISHDIGIGKITDFDHAFELRIKEGVVASEINRGLIRFWECRNDWDNRIWIYGRIHPGTVDKWTIHFEQKDDNKDLWIYRGTRLLDFGTSYYVQITRREKLCRLAVYTDSSRTELLEDSLEIMGVSKNYRYVWLASTLCTKKSQENWSSGYIADVKLNT
jgi:hypothetical protein